MNIRTLPSEVQRIAGHLACGRYVRSINYHNTPQRDIKLYQRQAAWLSEHYRAFTLDDADCFFDGTASDEGKPPILVGLFDGYRNSAEIFAPILEAYGLSGWFLLVADFIDTSGKRQEMLIDQYHWPMRSIAPRKRSLQAVEFRHVCFAGCMALASSRTLR